jgi:hypothetical protein
MALVLTENLFTVLTDKVVYSADGQCLWLVGFPKPETWILPFLSNKFCVFSGMPLIN